MSHSGGSVPLNPSLNIQAGQVESCCTTPSLQAPDAALGPQTALMKSLMMPSKSVLFQLVAGLDSVQSDGVSSVTTTRGFGNQGA